MDDTGGGDRLERLLSFKKLGRIQGGAGKRVRDGRRQHYNATFTDREGQRRRSVGWDYVHIAIDDATRLAYAEVLGDEKATTAVGFLRRAVAFFARHGITVERLLTDNGSPYRSAVHAIACRALGVRHLRTRAYRPQTNGKACVLASGCRPAGRRGSPRPRSDSGKRHVGMGGCPEPGWLRDPFPVP